MAKIIVLIFGLGLLTSCQKETKVKSFKVELKHFYGSEGYTVHYLLNQDSLKLRYDCDYENCKDTLLFKTRINKESAEKFYSFLTTLKLDTLKNNYETSGKDGRQTTVKISGESLKNKTINLSRFRHPTIEKLIDKVDSLIPENKFRMNSYKYKN